MQTNVNHMRQLLEQGRSDDLTAMFLLFRRVSVGLNIMAMEY